MENNEEQINTQSENIVSKDENTITKDENTKKDDINTQPNQDEKPAKELKKSSTKKAFWEFLKFTLFSLSAGIIQFGTYTILNKACGLSHWASHIPSLVLSVLWNFTFNRKFTFKSANNVPIAMLKVLCYYLVFTPLSTWWGDALEKAGWDGLLIEALTMLINFVTEFLYCKFFVFKEKKSQNKTKKQDV